MHKIYLYRSNGTWMAEHTDPLIRELFDTDTLPTAYTDEIGVERVVELVAAKFPQYEVWEK